MSIAASWRSPCLSASCPKPLRAEGNFCYCRALWRLRRPSCSRPCPCRGSARSLPSLLLPGPRSPCCWELTFLEHFMAFHCSWSWMEVVLDCGHIGSFKSSASTTSQVVSPSVAFFHSEPKPSSPAALICSFRCSCRFGLPLSRWHPEASLPPSLVDLTASRFTGHRG